MSKFKMCNYIGHNYMQHCVTIQQISNNKLKFKLIFKDM